MADEQDKPVAGGSPPPVPPSPPPAVPPAAPAPGAWRERTRGRPAQLIAAGLAGVVIGGGLVALLDVLDDKEERHVYVVEHRMGPYGRAFPGQPRRWPGQEDGRTRPMPFPDQPRGQVPPQTPEPAPTG